MPTAFSRLMIRIDAKGFVSVHDEGAYTLVGSVVNKQVLC